MSGELFKAFLISSFSGTCLTAVLALAKPITKKRFSAAWRYYIWLAVLVVMVLPVRISLPQRTGVPPLAAMPPVQTMQMTDDAPSDIRAEPTPEPVRLQPHQLRIAAGWQLNRLALLWLTGCCTLLLLHLAGYLRLIITMRKSSTVISCPQLADFTKKKVAVRVWENTSSPFMTGLFRPTLVLPVKELTSEQLHHILQHEITHLQRRDIWYKWFAALVKCIHWCNPAAWYIAGQIRTECEISCDAAVTRAMDADEKLRYIDTILSLLPTKAIRQIPLTTQMAGSKKTLKRRLEMMKNKKPTSKFASALSAVIAVLMLGTTVFASGVLSGLTADNITIAITNHGEPITLTHAPFIENGEVYLPLREMLEQLHITHVIRWNNGKIDMLLSLPAAIDQTREATEVSYELAIGSDSMVVNPDSENSYLSYAANMQNVPVLKDGKTYITYDFLDYMLGGAYADRHQVTYTVRDKAGKLIDTSRNNVKTATIGVDETDTVVYKEDDLKNPEHTVISFFTAFANGDFARMQDYCTENCRNTFLGDGYCFGMTRAALAQVEIDPLEYAKSSNDFNIFVTVNMTPHKDSVYLPDQTETGFYVMLLRQPDGRYLIDEFATGL